MAIVIAFLNQKGGAGKTTLATNVARQLQIMGNRVVIADSDPQGSARDWGAVDEDNPIIVLGADRESLPKDVAEIKQNYDYVVVDGAPQAQELAVAAIKAADVAIIPVQPSPYDIWACSDLVDFIQARQEVTDGKPKAAFIISRAIKNTKLGREVKEALTGYGLPVLNRGTTQRQIYAQSAALGSTPMDVDSDCEAAFEIKKLAKEIIIFAEGNENGEANVA